jgi:C_GCAxxG_C_C family probable redox protein
MISKGDLRFNCCESALLRIDEKVPLPDFGNDTMRIASMFGGGVCGWQSVCGAVSGASMAIGLMKGTNGNEDLDTFTEMRKAAGDACKEFMRAFEAQWGAVNCLDLLGVDFRTDEGRKIYNGMKERGETHCSEYVEWAAEWMAEKLSK